jgi:CHAT domain-containing protein
LSTTGHYGEAERRYRSALEEAQKNFDSDASTRRYRNDTVPTYLAIWSWAFTEAALADNLRKQGLPAEAEFYARSALLKTLQTFSRGSPRTADMTVNLASIVFEAGRFSDAAKLASAAVDVLEESGAVPESVALAQARAILGQSLVAQARWEEAKSVFEVRDRALSADPAQYEKVGGDNLSWGYALLKAGETRRALAMLQRIYDERRRRGLAQDEYYTAQSRGFLAMALAAVDERDKALAEFRAAVPVLIEHARASAAADQGVVARQLYMNWVLEAYIDLLLGQSPTPEEAINEAFRIADAARDSAVQRALAASAARATLGDPALADLARREQDALQRSTALGDLLNRLLSSPPNQQLPNVTAALRKDVEQLRAQRLEIKRDLERRYPAYAELIDPRPVTLAQAQSALRHDEALISIYVGAQKTYVWAIARDRPVSFHVANVGEGDVGRIVGQLRRAVDVSNPVLDDFPRFEVSLARELYAKVLEPVESGWRNTTTLFVVPHKALGQLPFATLVSSPPAVLVAGVVPFEEYRGVPWLVRRVAIVQLPSTGTLAALRRHVPVTADRREFAGFGDPIFGPSPADSSVRANEARGSVRLRNLAIARTTWNQPGALADPMVAVRSSAVANSSGLAQLARLPDTGDEILEIARTLGADPGRDVYLGAAASEKNVKSGVLANRRIIAFATHGLVPGDLNGLTQPALALSAPEVTGNAAEDGLLTMDEVLSLKLNADWVVLSACNTAAGAGAGTEAVSGLGRAFFYAGARSLLVSNWPVETNSARLLTTRLFAQQKAMPGRSRADALRLTMLEMIESGGRTDAATGRTMYSYAHPMFWAPFSLIGDGGP